MSYLIDVHHHATTNALLDRQRLAGIPAFPGMPKWNPQIAAETMSDFEINAAVLSVPADLSWIPEAERLSAVTDVNTELASIVANDAQHFGAFGVLAMPDPEAALTSIEHSLDVLELDGISMLTSYDGIYLTEPRYQPVLEELDRREAVVFVHPILVKEPIAGLSPALLEGTFDTTRFATKLAADNVLGRFPNIRFILPHTGGMVPWIKWRIAMYSIQRGDMSVPLDANQVEREIRKLDAFYYDTTLNLGALQRFERSDRVLFGTDVPWANPSVLSMQRTHVIGEAEALGNLDQVAFGNAFDLFPGLERRIRSAGS